jgi:hypothetical protein
MGKNGVGNGLRRTVWRLSPPLWFGPGSMMVPPNPYLGHNQIDEGNDRAKSAKARK